MNQWIAAGAVALGGAIGSVLRFLVGTWFVQRLGPGFPWGTLVINVTGSFAIGVVLTLAQTRMGLSPMLRLFFATGVLGGYTTFSAYAYEALLLARDAGAFQSVAYGLGSAAAGVGAALLGIVLTRVVFP